MENACTHCHFAWQSDYKMNHCPFCLQPLKPKKAGFEEVWAEMAEDDLKRNPNPSSFKNTWSWYEKLLKEGEYEKVISFLKRWKSLWNADIQNLYVTEYSDLEDPVLRIYAKALDLDNRSALMTLLHDPEDWESLHNSSWKPIDETLASYIWNHELYKTVQTLRNAGEENIIRFTIKDPELEERLTGLNSNVQDRLQYLKDKKEKNSIEDYLLALFHPLTGSENLFAHLEQIPSADTEFILAHEKELENLCLDLIHRDCLLRGMHLGINLFKSRDSRLEDICQRILHEHTIAVYLRPYAEIEQTDANW